VASVAGEMAELADLAVANSTVHDRFTGTAVLSRDADTELVRVQVDNVPVAGRARGQGSIRATDVRHDPEGNKTA